MVQIVTRPRSNKAVRYDAGTIPSRPWTRCSRLVAVSFVTVHATAAHVHVAMEATTVDCISALGQRHAGVDAWLVVVWRGCWSSFCLNWCVCVK